MSEPITERTPLVISAEINKIKQLKFAGADEFDLLPGPPPSGYSEDEREEFIL